ncbi:hypothetical protein VSR34_36770 [Paraburkholderia sp. JHI2823]|uniref:hypothetical protein n=1 Tax=Paraburkholderia sp. JHI2823 TaxID=3112960 RepID=UPI00317652F0
MAINKNCSITNKSGKSVVVLNAFNSSTNVAQNSPKQGYLQELTLLALSSGGKVLANGAVRAVMLDGTYTDSKGQTKPCFIYQLLISQPDSLFPVMSVGEALDFSTQGYPPISVTEAAAANMAKALSFCQNIMTSPTSKMATGFQSAMTDAFKLPSVSDSEKAIAAFFNQYDLFKGLDFPSYVAVSTWMRGYAYLWGMDDKGQPGRTYYVYSAPGEGKTGATSEGTIVFGRKSGAPSPADPADRSSGMTITLTGSSGSTSTLSFDNGQIVDTAGAVALNAAFGFKGTFTGKESDTTAWPILTGTLLNKKVIAIPLAPESGWDKFWSNLTFDKVLGYFLQAMGVWMAIDFLKQKLTGKDNKLRDDQANENSGDAPNRQQQQDAQDAGDEIGNDARQQDQQLAERAAGDGNVQVSADDAGFANDVSAARQSGSEAYSEVAGDDIRGGIDSASTQLKDLAQIEVNEQIEEAEGNLVDASSKLKAGQLSEANQSLGEVTQSLPDIVENLGDQVSQQLKEQVEEAVEVQQEASDVAEETSDNADEARSGDEEPFDDGVIPE